MAKRLAGEQFCREAVDLAHGLREDTRVAKCAASFAQIADRTILGAGFAVARASAYLRNNAANQELLIDVNDLEDYFICLHLGASTGRTFVTDDNDVYEAINYVIAAFTEFAQSIGEILVLKASVIKTKDFRNEISTVKPQSTP